MKSVCFVACLNVILSFSLLNAETAKDQVLDCLLQGNIESAEKVLEKAEGTDEDWNSFKQDVEKVLELPGIVRKAYGTLKGKTTTVYLKTGTEKLLIKDVSDEEVQADKQIISGGRVVGAAAKNFKFNDLSPKDKLVRLGKNQSPESNIMRGVLACSAGLPDKAVPYFEKAGDGLGKLLLKRIDERKFAKDMAANQKEKAEKESAAEQAFSDTLKILTIRFDNQDEETLLKTVCSLKLSQEQIDMVRKSAAYFSEKHEKTDLAGKYQNVVNVFGRLMPDMPLYVERDTVDKALKALTARYPDAKLCVNVKHSVYELEIDISKNPWLENIEALKGLPISKLTMWDTGVRDLSPLKGMPLRYLNIAFCEGVKDLSPLKGLPLESLHLKGNHNSPNLSPLKGMPLKHLRIPSIFQGSIEPLKGLPLESFETDWNESIRDLSPLRGAPMKKMVLLECVNLSDLSPLKEMPLEYLSLEGCKKMKDLSPLEGMKTLKTLDLRKSSVTDLTPVKKIEGLVIEQ